MTGEDRRKEIEREEREGNRGRVGFGDDGGTRIGRPTPAAGAGQEHSGPSTHWVDSGLEGSILDEEQAE